MASPRSEGSPPPGRGVRPQSDADLIAGLVFVAFGVAFGVGSLNYELGSLREMGSGYAPLALAVVLVGLGSGVIAKAYVSPDTHHPGELPSEEASHGLRFERVHWRPIVFVVAAVLFFALTVDGLGLLPATFGTSAIAAFAGKAMSPVRALAIAAGLMVGCYVVFVVLLQLRLPLLGDWLG